MANTGLANALQQLTCAGPAAPTPDWAGYATNPGLDSDAVRERRGRNPLREQRAERPARRAKDYTSPRSVRGNLQWSGFDPRTTCSTPRSAGPTRSTSNQPETVDLNFNPTQRFTLASEGNRPVFVNPTSIDPATGRHRRGRRPRQHGVQPRVRSCRTDLTSTSKQLQVSLSPDDVQHEVELELCVHLPGVPGADRRLQQHRRRTRYDPAVGARRTATGATRSSTRCSTTSSTRCACRGPAASSRARRSRRSSRAT